MYPVRPLYYQSGKFKILSDKLHFFQHSNLECLTLHDNPQLFGMKNISK